jgi:HD-GYP domain-containing protein (c-di-GMP phosphodiesterase class II)
MRYLLQRDVAVTEGMRRRLLQLGVAEVWVRCEELAFLEDVVDVELGERQRELYSDIRRNFERFSRVADAKLDFESFQRSITNLFQYLRNSAVGIRFLDKVQLFDDYLMTHSANVAYLAMLVGMKLDWYLIDERRRLPPAKAKDVVALGLGCLLHDVGKLKVPKEILDKPGRLTPEEMEAVKRHPVLGYDMVKGRVPLAASQVVLHHHQRWDGLGYPVLHDPETGDALRRERNRIHVFARIASICDVFDAATSKRVYSDAKPSVQALAEMRKYNAGCFDPVVQRAFYEIVPPFPIGALLTLSNGFQAAAVDFDPAHPCRPRVKPIYYPDGERCRFPDTREIDLSQSPELYVHKVGRIDVRPFLFDDPDVAPAAPAAAAAT